MDGPQPLRAASSPSRFKRGGAPSFTLIELVVAIALVAFVLTTILGMLSLAVKQMKGADSNTRVAILLKRVDAYYRSQSFTNVLGSPPSASYSTNFYFSYLGIPTNQTTDPAYFRCYVTNVTSSSYGSLTNNLALLQIQTSWPRPAYTSTNVSVISICNYQ
jgi:uncharacterized protein (TIGR02598 family)